MATEKTPGENGPIELEDQDIEQAAGGRKPLPAPSDPCTGGEVKAP